VKNRPKNKITGQASLLRKPNVMKVRALYLRIIFFTPKYTDHKSKIGSDCSYLLGIFFNASINVKFSPKIKSDKYSKGKNIENKFKVESIIFEKK
jgi:hypothetical protein